MKYIFDLCYSTIIIHIIFFNLISVIKRLFFIILFLLTIPVSVQAGEEQTEWKTINITKNNTILLNLSKDTKLNKYIKDWTIKLNLVWNNKLKLVTRNDRIYFHISWFNVQEEWKLEACYKDRCIEIPYNVNYIKDSLNFNVVTDMLENRIQKRPLSCESSATSDIVYFFTGEPVDEYDIYDKLDKDMGDTEAKDMGDWKAWWNPNKWFVGHVDYYWKDKSIRPSQREYTWYGVYEKPIAKVYNQYWLETNILNIDDHHETFWPQEHLDFILKSLQKWQMVQLWWDRCTDPSEEDWTIPKNEFNEEKSNQWYSWKNDCKSIYRNRALEWYYQEDWKRKKHIWLSWEHAFYLLWYDWEIDNPTKIIVWDTNTWYHKYSKKEWMRKWEKMDYRSIIVSEK